MHVRVCTRVQVPFSSITDVLGVTLVYQCTYRVESSPPPIWISNLDVAFHSLCTALFNQLAKHDSS